MLAELERLGTVAAVARSLHLTAPGVSMQLASLEREVGLQLTERRGRMLALTPAGQLLAQHGSDIVERISLAELEVGALKDGTAGSYRVAAFPSAVRTIVAGTWRALVDKPELGIQLRVVELEPQDALPALAAGEVELAVTHAYSNMATSMPSGMSATRIASEPVWLAVPDGTAVGHSSALSALSQSGPVDLRDYATRDWIVPHRSWACYEMIQRACGLAGFEPRAVAEATDFAAQLALVAAGAGVALVPQLTIAQLPDGVALHKLLAPVVRHDYIVTRDSTRADAGIRQLAGLLTASAARLVPAAVKAS